jgi:N-methylhydantoinase B/oxoprolinase/acetone carboxylase alpha subunit
MGFVSNERTNPMATKFDNTIDLASQVVDRLGDIKAQIAELKAVEANLIALIINTGDDVIEGGMFRAAVSTTADRTSLDVKAAEAKLRELGVDGRWFSKNQKVTRGYTSVRVSARKSGGAL